MPLLQKALQIGDGPDPGTRPWDLQNALGGGNREDNKLLDDVKKDSASCNEKPDDSYTDMFGSYYLGVEINDEDINDMQPLPEDAFHSQDILSRHLLQQKEDEQKANRAKNDQGRDGADVEYINVNDFRPKPHNNGAKGDDKSCTLKKAQSIMKTSLQCQGSIMGSDLVLGLV